ncbi:hypothetical protein HMPREF9946_02240 [Acetobacteraceae bacterium AT-5844]|nr:hypothetical protein HMPREF9946_02240 [Acetobacteraceae bacterium AT-5844]
MIRSSVEPRQVIYGRARVSGPMVYASSSGPDLRYLHLVLPLAGHRVNAITNVWINDVLISPGQIDGAGMVTSGQYAGRVRIRKYLGDQTAADPDLVAESTDGWTAQHVLYGVAYLYLRLEYNNDAFPSGLSNISAEVEGALVHDPRTGATGYSNNWANCLLDYLRSDYGLACADDEIDFGSFVIAANLSDEQVQLNAEGTEWQSRYTCDGSFKLDEEPIDVIEKLLTAGGGSLVYVQGRYQLRGGAYEAPTDTLTASDLAGDLEIITKPSRKDIFNSVRGTFVDPDNSWQASDFPVWQSPTYLAQDGEEIWKDLQLPFTINGTRCQRLAKQLVLTERESLQINATLKYSAIRHSVMQTLAVTMPDLGWINKPFRIRSWKFDPVSGAVILQLREDGPGSYGWLYDEAANIPPSPDTNLISPLAIPAPTNLAVVATTALNRDGAAVPALLVTFTPAAHAFVNSHEVQWRISPSGEWNSAEVPAPTGRYVISPVIVGQAMDVRVRAIAILTRSPWTGIYTAAGEPDTTPPGQPAGGSVVGAIRQHVIRWTNATDSDLAKVEIWESDSNDLGAAYKQGESYSDYFVREIEANQTRWYWGRSVDRSGNVSGHAYLGTATSRYAETFDIADGAVSGLDVDFWNGDTVGTSWLEIMSCQVGDPTYPARVAISAEIQFQGQIIVTPGGEGGDNIDTPVGAARLLVNGVVVREVDLLGGGATIVWGNTIAPGVVPATVEVQSIYAAADRFPGASMTAFSTKR